MLTWHSFLQSVMFFVRSISVKVTKNHYRSSSVLMSGAVVIAVVAFSANGFGGSGKNAMAAPVIEENGVQLAENEKEVLLLELFPMMAHNFLSKKKQAHTTP